MPPQKLFFYAGLAHEVANPNHRELRSGCVFAYDLKDAQWRALSRFRDVRLPEVMTDPDNNADGTRRTSLWTGHEVTVEEIPLEIVRKLIRDVPTEYISRALQETFPDVSRETFSVEQAGKFQSNLNLILFALRPRAKQIYFRREDVHAAGPLDSLPRPREEVAAEETEFADAEDEAGTTWRLPAL